MLLKKLIKNVPKEIQTINVKGLAIDSKKIKKGFIFFAIKGKLSDGEYYIEEAIKNGAVAVVCSKSSKYKNKVIPVFKTLDIRAFLATVCSKFYREKPKNIIAVTGTNGKTSVADLFYQILSLNKIPVASIGTLGIKYKKKIIKSNLTTPDTILLHHSLSNIKKEKIDNVIIEASSHGLHQKRMNNLNLRAGIFTNFSQDHLDYHKTMKSYFNSKLILFKHLLKKKKNIISDKSIKEFQILKKISRSKKLKLVEIESIKNRLEKNFKFKDIGFHIKNLSMAIAAARLCGINEKKIFSTLKKIKDVNGRLELVKVFTNNVKVYIDFAHTPDALNKAIESLKNIEAGKVSLVFGCGGNRDKSKRPLMGKIASDNCEKIYVTDDNPRKEKPDTIRKEIIKNIKNKNCFNIGNRAKAIKFAILNADPNEIILIAGKGHEDEQIYKNKTISISDKQLIKKLKLNIKKISSRDQLFLENKNILSSILKKRKKENFHGLAIDSRVLKKNNLFLTIKGKNNDGIKFVSQALKKGAKYIISSRKIKKYTQKVIEVNDEIKFLNNFAKSKRKSTTAKIIAITGSAGKTSLKNLTKDLLNNYAETFCSPKSYNNHFGVPLSLSNLRTNHKFGVFEVGMSKAGEISKLSKFIRPHVGIITNIGEAHIENFNNLRGIAKSKGEIIDNILKGGTLILNRDDKFFNYLKKRAYKKKLKVVSFGISQKSDVFPKSILKKKSITKLILKISDQVLNVEYKDLNIYNVLSSIALLSVLNLNLNKASSHFKKYKPVEGRGKIHNIKRYNKHFKLIDESYNANPLSVKNAINNFNSIKKQNFKKYLLLGDMLELGKKSDYLHKDLSKVINNSDIDKVFIKGDKTFTTYKNINKEKRGNIFQFSEDVDFTLRNILSNNDYLMIKGSNATGLNNISKRIIKGN